MTKYNTFHEWFDKFEEILGKADRDLIRELDTKVREEIGIFTKDSYEAGESPEATVAEIKTVLYGSTN